MHNTSNKSNYPPIANPASPSRWKAYFAPLVKGCLTCLGLGAIALFWAMYPKLNPGPITNTHIQNPEHEVPTPSNTLRIATWNIAWAYGKGSEGSTAYTHTKDKLDVHLQHMATWLKDNHIDIAFLQEVDLHAQRSNNLNQALYLSQHSPLAHAATLLSWDVNYLPFPYWPPHHQWGPMQSGGAILSRYPLHNCSGTLFPHPPNNPWWYNLGYPYRYLQHCDVTIKGHTLRLWNTHLEAFQGPHRQTQATMLKEILNQDTHPLQILGGDFNSVGPESPQRHHYADELHGDHRTDATLHTIRSIANLRDSLPLSRFKNKPEAYFTFPADNPNRRLDYIFLRGDALSATHAFRSTTRNSEPSDHLPFVTDIKWPPTPTSSP